MKLGFCVAYERLYLRQQHHEIYAPDGKLIGSATRNGR
jgi:hypothetical protein